MGMAQIKAVTTEHEQARAWRKARGLNVKQLADLTGYSIESIYCFERGVASSAGTGPVKPWVWQRYKRACSGLDAELRSGLKFEWEV